MVMEDKVYEELDFVSKLVEPWDLVVMKVFAKIPNEHTLTIEQILSIDSYRSQNNQAYAIISKLVQLDDMPKWAVNMAFELASFSFEIVGEQVEIDVETRTKYGGEVVFKTQAPQLNEIPIRVFKRTFNSLNYSTPSSKFKNNPRIREVLGVLEVHGGSRKSKAKMDEVYRGLVDIVENDKWRIRSDQVLVNMVEWIFTYIATGNYSAYASLLNLKCMVHRGNPIYSAEEI